MAAVISRYARALADVILERHLNSDQILAQLNDLVETLNSNPNLRHVWDNPSIPAEQKRAVLDGIARRIGMAPQARNFVAVIMDHRRILALPQIVQQVRAELNQRLGIAEAEITVARELSPEEKRVLENRVSSATGKLVRASYHLDPAILGGAVVRIGSTIYNGSVKGQLEKLKEALIEQ
jgi:F-type H+-transporting ATPase subunit delta